MNKIISVVLLVIVSNIDNYGQDNVLPFSEAISIALKNNVVLKQQHNQQYVNQVLKTSQMAQMAPRITAFAQGWRVQGNQFIEQEARVVNDAETSNFFGSLDANILIFNGFNRVNSIKQASANLEAQQHLVNRTRQDVIANVSRQYLNCLLDKELLQIAKEDLNNQKTLLMQIAEMVKEGSSAKVDEYNQLATVKSAELAMLRAEIRLRRDKLVLSQTLARDATEEFVVVEPDWGLHHHNLVDTTLDVLYSQALSSREDLLRAKKNVESAEKAVAVSKASFLPTISGFGTFASRYSNASIPEFSNQINDNQSKEYGVRINIPIFSGMQNNSGYVQSKVNYDNAKMNMNNSEIIVKSDVVNAVQNYKEATTSLSVSKAQLEAAKLSYDLEQERYRLGVSDLVASTQANQRYIQAKGDMAQASYTLLFQNILLRYAIGTLTIEDIP